MKTERKEFKKDIRASLETVWNVLWNDDTYKAWTEPFHKNSKAESDWQEGSEVKFIAEDGSGMLSTVVKNEQYHKLYLEHQGLLKNGKLDTENEYSTQWKGLREDYTLTQTDDITTIFVQMDIPLDYMESTTEAWPKGLEIVMQIAEKLEQNVSSVS